MMLLEIYGGPLGARCMLSPTPATPITSQCWPNPTSLPKENDFFDVNSTTTAEDVIQHFNGAFGCTGDPKNVICACWPTDLLKMQPATGHSKCPPEERASCTIASGSIAMPDTAAATPKWPTGIRRPGMAKVIWDLRSRRGRRGLQILHRPKDCVVASLWNGNCYLDLMWCYVFRVVCVQAWGILMNSYDICYILLCVHIFRVMQSSRVAVAGTGFQLRGSQRRCSPHCWGRSWPSWGNRLPCCLAFGYMNLGNRTLFVLKLIIIIIINN